MKLLIKQCGFCPMMPDCEYRKLLKAETRKALPNVTVIHSCPEYRKLFKEGDEVLATPVELNEHFKYEKMKESFRGVIISVPTNGRKNRYAVAFFEPIELSNGQKGEDADTITKYILGMKADQLVKTGEYEGHAFWESGKYLTN